MAIQNQFEQPGQPVQPAPQTLQPEGTFGAPAGDSYQFGTQNQFTPPGADVDTGDIMDLLAEGSALLAPVADSELLTKLAEALKARFVSKGKAIADLTIHLIDQTMARTPVSALAIVYKKDVPVPPVKEGAPQQTRTMFFTTTLLLEASASRMSSLPFSHDNRMLELQATVGHVWNNDFWSKVVNSLSKEFGKVEKGQLVTVSESSFVDSSVLVVPKDLNIEDERAIHNLAYNALAAISTASGAMGRPLNLVSRVLQHNYLLSSNTDFSSRQVYNQLGRAVRSDWVITTSVTRNQQQNQNQQVQNWMVQQNQSSVIAELTGFVDIAYIGQTAAPVQGYGMQQAMGTQCYGAELVITNASTRFHDLSLEKLLFALVTAFSMEKDGTWAWSFVPRQKNKSGIDRRDIGALGLDVDIKGDGNLVPFRGPDGKPMSQEELGTFLNHLFYRNLRFSIDVDPTGVNGWILNDFVRAAQNVPDVGAVHRILNACNQLTNGHFATLWQNNPASSKPLACIRGYFNLGEYTDSDGEKRDVRDFDYLASINLLPNREGFARYQASVESSRGWPVPVCLATQQELITSVWPNASFYGVGTRVMISPALLETVSQAMALAGIALRPENQRTSAWGTVTTRGDASMLQWGVSGVGNAVYNWHAGNANTQQFGSFGGRLSGYGY